MNFISPNQANFFGSDAALFANASPQKGTTSQERQREKLQLPSLPRL
jgi:hypothetical protein